MMSPRQRAGVFPDTLCGWIRPAAFQVRSLVQTHLVNVGGIVRLEGLHDAPPARAHRSGAQVESPLWHGAALASRGDLRRFSVEDAGCVLGCGMRRQATRGQITGAMGYGGPWPVRGGPILARNSGTARQEFTLHVAFVESLVFAIATARAALRARRECGADGARRVACATRVRGRPLAHLGPAADARAPRRLLGGRRFYSIAACSELCERAGVSLRQGQPGAIFPGVGTIAVLLLPFLLTCSLRRYAQVVR